MQCPGCGTEAGDSIFCPRCGRQLGAVQARPAAPRQSDAPRLLVGLAIIAAAALAYCVFSPKQPAPTPTATPDGAWDVCKQYVGERLKAPSTAQFPDQDAATITKESARRYMVVGYVDSQNGFGAQLRSRFACEVDWTGGTNWTLVGVRIE